MAALGNLAALAGLGSSANPYGSTSQGQWNLARGVYTRSDGRAMTFFFESGADEPRHQRTGLEQVQDTGGRRIARYEYPYRDGQNLKDLGRKGETYVFNLKFFGLDYQRRFQEFREVVARSNLGGTIVHPVLGAITVRFSEYENIHRFDEWNAVTIRATFLEDTSDKLSSAAAAPLSTDGALRDGMQTLAKAQTFLTNAIGDADLLNVARTTLKNRLSSVVGQVSQLLGNLTATYSSDAKLKGLVAQGSTQAGGITQLSSGTVATGTGVDATLPPVYQTGFDQPTQALVNAQIDAFVQASQVTTPQAVFQANQVRQAIRAAITEAEDMLGLGSVDIALSYRELAVSVQQSVEASISTSQSVVRVYVVPRAMSLRKVATENGLGPDRQNDIEALNPSLPSVNVVPAGTVVTVPAA